MGQQTAVTAGAGRSRLVGQSFVELAAGLIILIPIILVLIDLAIIVMAQQLNDTVCRDAARTAAAGPPDGLEPKTRADKVIKNAVKAGGYITNIELIDAKATITGDPGTAGGPIQGGVRVETKITVKVPAAIPPLPQTVDLHSAQVFPITFIRPSTISPL